MKTPTRLSAVLILGVLAGACSSNTKGISSGKGDAGRTPSTGAAGGDAGATGGTGGGLAGGSCTGTADDCEDYDSQAGCQAVGCAWDSRAEIWCTGTSRPCAAFTTPSLCASAGCDWQSGLQPDAGADVANPDVAKPDLASMVPDAAADSRDAPASSDLRGPDSGALDSATLSAADGAVCDGSAMNGTWYRAIDGLSMILTSDGCTIAGTADNTGYRHTISGTYDSVAHTMIGKIRRTTISNGCTTIMMATWVLTEPTRFTLMITSTDGACDLLRTFTEQSVFVRSPR